MPAIACLLDLVGDPGHWRCPRTRTVAQRVGRQMVLKRSCHNRLCLLSDAGLWRRVTAGELPLPVIVWTTSECSTIVWAMPSRNQSGVGPRKGSNRERNGVSPTSHVGDRGHSIESRRGSARRLCTSCLVTTPCSGGWHDFAAKPPGTICGEAPRCLTGDEELGLTVNPFGGLVTGDRKGPSL